MPSSCLRHSYASWMLAAGVPAYDVARCLGSSVRMLDLTCGHLIKGSETTAPEWLDAFVSREHNQQVEARWHGSTAT
jgi:hypothetical protein